MPTHSANLRRLSISQLNQITGRSPRYISERLRSAGLQPVAEDGRTLFFDPRQALPVLFEVDTAQAERARLDRARREEIELRLAKERGELIEADVPERWVVALAQNVRDRILGTP